MQIDWRSNIRKRLGKSYIQSEQDWFDMYFSTAGHVDLTVVSNRFIGLSYVERRVQIQELFKELGTIPEIGMLFLYTPDEAQLVGLKPQPKVSEQEAYSWLDQAQIVANLEAGQTLTKHSPRQPRTIAFYSFKGGVGRTTALTHIAWTLARRGRKVVVVDLDLEAPGLSSAFQSVKSPPNGIVDYFYSHAYAPPEDEQFQDNEVSRYRCEKLEAEYPDLHPFFSNLKGRDVSLPEKELSDLWTLGVQKQSRRFESASQFISFLVDIGLLRALKYQYGDVQYYRFADIYATGFGLLYRKY